MRAYIQGFIDKCAEHGIDPVKLASVGGAASGALSGAGWGATVGSIVPAVGTAVGAGIGATIGAVGGAFKKSKPKLLEPLAAKMPEFRPGEF